MTDFVPFSQAAEFTLPAANDTVWIAPSVMVRASGAGEAGIRGDFSGHMVTIFGTVASIDYIAIRLGNDTTAPGHTLDIREGGQVVSFYFGTYGVQLWGVGTVVKNAGLIHGDASGLTLTGNGLATTSTVSNSGTIETRAGIALNHAGNDSMVVTNSGLITTGSTSAFAGGSGVDTINNSGRIAGNILLGGGNDRYSGAIGRVDGTVFGSSGDDVIIGGARNERFEGGNDNDTLSGSGGIDTLLGDDGLDTLNGGIGNDILDGGLQNDILIGGLGKDVMTGGTGSDTFKFTARTHSVVGVSADRILDFDDGGAGDKIDVSALFGPKMIYRHGFAFTAAGQVRINDVAGADVIVEVNTGGTFAPDFSIRLINTTLASMNAGDFVL
jgi:Ca2+-binding RTX toxin-like protein